MAVHQIGWIGARSIYVQHSAQPFSERTGRCVFWVDVADNRGAFARVKCPVAKGGGAFLPYLYLRVAGGFRWAFGLHWGFYAVDAALTH